MKLRNAPVRGNDAVIFRTRFRNRCADLPGGIGDTGTALNGIPMITLLLVTLMVAGGLCTFLALKMAPEGYEDENGFQCVSQPKPALRVLVTQRIRSALAMFHAPRSVGPLFRRAIFH